MIVVETVPDPQVLRDKLNPQGRKIDPANETAVTFVNDSIVLYTGVSVH